MPVKTTVENPHRLFVSYWFGRITEADMLRAIAELADGANGSGTYRGLVVFAPRVDLSEWSSDVLTKARAAAKASFVRLGLGRGASAAVLHGGVDAGLVMPLWNALCDTDPEIDLGFTFFHEIETALDYLGAPPDVGKRVRDLIAAAER